MHRLARAVLFGVMAACSSVGPTDGGAGGAPGDGGGGAGGGGGSGGAGGAQARPSRTVTSSDGKAYLWIPDGGAPADVAITVTAIDGGYAFGPSGLVFDRAALFFFPASPRTAPDAGFTLLKARLRSEDGGTEPAKAIRVAAVGHNGPDLGLGVVEVRHFSELRVETVPEGATRAEGVDVLVEPSPRSRTFDREVGSPSWRGRIILARSVMPYFVGNYVVAASGSIEILPSSPVDVGLPRPVNLVTQQLESADFDVQCKEKGPGTLTVTVWTPDFSQALAVAHSGECREKAVLSAADPTRVAPGTSPTTGEQALVAATTQVAQRALPDKAPSELAAPAQAAAVATNPPKQAPPAFTIDFELECVTDCALAVDFLGKAKVKNVSGTEGQLRGVGVGSDLLGPMGSAIAVTPIVGGVGPLFEFPGQNTLLLGAPLSIAHDQTIEFAFNYRCIKDGLGNTGSLVHYEHDPRPLSPPLTGVDFTKSGDVQKLSPLIKCGKGGDAIMLADNARVTRTGSTFSVAAPGVTANLIHAHADVQAGFFPIGNGTNLYRGVATFRSNQGLSPITVRSALQTATATFNGTRYVFSGLASRGAFSATDTLTIEATPPGMPLVSLSVTAPPPLADINAFFGPRQGLRTEVRIPDGTFDTFFVSVVGGPPGAPAGQAGLLRLVPASQMTLTGGNRVAPVLTDDVIASLNTLGWTVQTLYIAYYRQQETQLFFPGQRALPVQAGRMFQVTAADLNP